MTTHPRDTTDRSADPGRALERCRPMATAWGAALRWGWAGALGGLLGIAGAQAEVTLELAIPEAETHVIGDPTPLRWRFLNRSTEPLAFMWEGCCRLNGRLDVTSEGRRVETAPVGQALAHMFARADTLEPGVAKEYETRVSDWVLLPGTGSYRLVGTYRGVLPSQFPQVRRGQALWREAAESAPLGLKVLGVDDYLAQREDRSRRRGLRMALTGPDRLPPLGSLGYELTFENPSERAQSVRWPEDVAFWVLDAAGGRVAPAAVISGPIETLTIPARGRLQRSFTVGAERWEGEPLGEYRVFVDLSAGTNGEPRVSSNPIPLSWRLGPVEVKALVEAAAQGAGTGARNAPLKLLRVYLLEVGPWLAGLDRSGLAPDARGLAERLSAAAKLKPLAPKPGPAEVTLSVPARGWPRWSQPAVASVLGQVEGPLSGQVAELLSVRRHLGWEVAIALEPEPDASVGRVLELAAECASASAEVAVPTGVWVATGGTNAPARLVLAGGRQGGGPVLRLTPGGREWSGDGENFVAVGGGDDLGSRLAGMGSGGMGIRVRASRGLTWGGMLDGIRPLLTPGARVEVAGEEGDGGAGRGAVR